MRPDDSRFVYAVKPAIWTGAFVGLIVLIASSLMRLWGRDERFAAFLGAFVATTSLVALVRLRRRARDPSAFRSPRPRGWRAEDQWRYWMPGAAAVVLGVVAWLIARR